MPAAPKVVCRLGAEERLLNLDLKFLLHQSLHLKDQSLSTLHQLLGVVQKTKVVVVPADVKPQPEVAVVADVQVQAPERMHVVAEEAEAPDAKVAMKLSKVPPKRDSKFQMELS